MSHYPPLSLMDISKIYLLPTANIKPRVCHKHGQAVTTLLGLPRPRCTAVPLVTITIYHKSNCTIISLLNKSITNQSLIMFQELDRVYKPAHLLDIKTDLKIQLSSARVRRPPIPSSSVDHGHRHHLHLVCRNHLITINVPSIFRSIIQQLRMFWWMSDSITVLFCHSL